MPRLRLPVIAAELDAENAADTIGPLGANIDAAGVFDVELDFAAVRFIDSSAIGALVELKNALESSDGRLALIHVQPRPCRVLTISGLLGAFNAECDHDH